MSSLYVGLSTGNVGIGTSSVTRAKTHISHTGAGDIFRVDDEASETTPFVIDANGNVGIGTTNPVNMLNVNGTLSKLTEVSISTSFNLNNAAWYVIGRFDGVEGSRLEIKVLGCESYDITAYIPGGALYIYASINNNYNAAYQNISGIFTSIGGALHSEQ